MDEPSDATSRHRCLIYEGHPSEQLPVIAPLLLDGLKERRRCLYLGDPGMVAMVRAALAERGLDVPEAVARGALVFSSDRSHLRAGRFDPDGMVTGLKRLVDDAVRDGYSGLWATGDMRWETGEDADADRLREYEARLERVFDEKPLAGVCQYHRATLPPRTVQTALESHRAVHVGGALLRDNLFFVPPDLLLRDDPGARDRLAEWTWSQVTRVVRAERDRDRARSALEEANKELEARVKARTADLEEFTRSVTHDLRGPLGLVAGLCADIRRSHAPALDAAGRAEFERVEASVVRLEELIEALSELFAISRRPFEAAEVDLSALAREAGEALRRSASERETFVSVQDGLAARGDARMLRSVLANLLGNAWKFTSKTPGATIEFGAEDSAGRAVYFVRDTGVGFDTEGRDRLFRTFSRLHKASDYPGHGLGLALVRRVIARHGGEVWAYSTPGRGASFYFTLGGA